MISTRHFRPSVVIEMFNRDRKETEPAPERNNRTLRQDGEPVKDPLKNDSRLIAA